MPASILDAHDFSQYFSGNKTAYGLFRPVEVVEGKKAEGTCSTEYGEVSDELYLAHLNGKTSIGIIPIAEDNTVNFVVIDVDVYADHKVFLSIIYEHNLPVLPFRSKSGGLHLYIFFSTPVKASEGRDVAQKFRKLFGLHSKTEIFPKQASIKKGGAGSWINLPYFKKDDTERYMFDVNGEALSFDEAMFNIKQKRSSLGAILSLYEELPLSDAPPCLQTLYLRGDTNMRNQYMFSLARYYKAKYGDDFESYLIEANNKLPTPLKLKELTDTAIASHKKKDYAYKCGEDPILSICDDTLCKKRAYGVGNDEMSNLSYEDFIQYDTDPPYYEWIIDGQKLKFFNETDIIQQSVFRELVFRKLHKLPPRLKEHIWTKIVNRALLNIKLVHVEIEDDISSGAMFREFLVEFLTKRAVAKNKEQLLVDRVYKDETLDAFLFKSRNFIIYLYQHKGFREFGQTEVHERLMEMGGRPLRYYVNANNKNLRLWSIPASAISNLLEIGAEDVELDFEDEEGVTTKEKEDLEGNI